MEREEIEAMWERIKALEENQLKVSKAMAIENMASFNNLAIVITAITDKRQAYKEYMGPKLDQATKDIFSVGNVGEVIELLHNFNSDCISFLKSVVKYG